MKLLAEVFFFTPLACVGAFAIALVSWLLLYCAPKDLIQNLPTRRGKLLTLATYYGILLLIAACLASGFYLEAIGVLR